MRHDPRLIQNTQSILNVMAILELIIATPGLFSQDQRIVAALASQGALAKLSMEEKGIYPSSTNTLKRISEKELNGGFLTLDTLRLNAKRAMYGLTIQSESKPKSTKEKMIDKNINLQAKLQQAQQDCWKLTIAFNRAMSQGKRYAFSSGNETLIALCQKEQKELRAMFSLVSSHKP